MLEHMRVDDEIELVAKPCEIVRAEVNALGFREQLRVLAYVKVGGNVASRQVLKPPAEARFRCEVQDVQTVPQ